ncbi:type VII secretion protein EccB [Mycolicibacter hiberniae]|uniref:ESX-3 secretion system protein eccB3 n=1 Tax=Mycolicibacter hiberniae TaxID=29314 RepID=A0A7I7X911_9MYCO|nr:type VII secretion protein EccB [Mycolicibacter hiberniae]MCV7084250.1 type VII secretion protein EccB [Mycolicibacter hiberniae]ORV65936.1 type VII secretion protein EccB [Mycolicibacter hiberniae]BBZ25377.1 ESX-3 secretion system protein eccB3 [Mycolicibacter hiberniae]
MSAGFERPDDERRSFASRTPVNDNPDRVEYRRGFVTKHQVSGWRFVMRRIASGVALHDTRMLVEPLRSQTRAVLMGLLVLVTVVGGCFVFTLIWPNSAANDDPVLADRTTSALYVRVGEQLHPVLNLTSARLIAGRPVNPTMVKGAALDKFARGNLIGIPGAPERMVQNSSRDAEWTVCDAVSGSTAGVTVIAGPLDHSGSRAGAPGADAVVLADNGSGAWMLWDGKRSRIDLSDRAVTAALGLGERGAAVPTPRTIATGLFNTVPEAPALVAPVIAGAGAKPAYDLPVAAPVGAVVAAHVLDGGSEAALRYYAVLEDGLQPISGVLAAVLRNTDSHGLERPPVLGADDIARLPVSRGLDVARFPERPVHVVDGVSAPVTCAQWSKPAGASTSSLTLLSGSTLPLREGVGTLDLVGAGVGGTAARVALTPGTGYFVQSVSSDPTADAKAGPLFWISDTGVRYGINTEAGSAGGDGDTVSALGLSEPALAVPWSVLSQFALGPTLSRADALLAHDGLAPDPSPGRRATTELGTAANGGETR